jgi:hypothetical protein
MLVYPKEMIIEALRDFFSKDSFYHYSKNQWGYPNTTDHTDLPPGGDIPEGHPGSNSLAGDLLPTRLFIGENFRHEGIYYPAILVKSGGSKYVPISINRNQGEIQYEDIIYEDGYGNQTTITRPAYFVTAGAWEGSIIIDIMTRSLRARDDLVEAVAMCFTEIYFDDLHQAGIIVKPVDISGASEADDRNDKLFRQTITLNIRTEWRREIPINSFIDAIFFTIYFQDVSRPDNPISENLTINSVSAISDVLENI